MRAVIGIDAVGRSDTLNGSIMHVRLTLPQLEAFLLSVGRQKFVIPLYTALRKDAGDKAWAEQVYKRARPRYHPVTQASVDKLMTTK